MNPKTTLGGVTLGKHYYEVIMNVELKRDEILPCPYPVVEMMAIQESGKLSYSHCFLFSHM